MKGYKSKKKKYENKLESQCCNNFKPISAYDINGAMAEMVVIAQMIKIKKKKVNGNETQT